MKWSFPRSFTFTQEVKLSILTLVIVGIHCIQAFCPNAEQNTVSRKQNFEDLDIDRPTKVRLYAMIFVMIFALWNATPISRCKRSVSPMYAKIVVPLPIPVNSREIQQ